MAPKLQASMPIDLDLPDGWTVRVTALDSAGAVVAAVKVSDMAIIADAPLGTVPSQLEVGPFMLVPGPGA